MSPGEQAEVEAFYPRYQDAMANGTGTVRNSLANEMEMYSASHHDLDQWAIDQLLSGADNLRNGTDTPATEASKSSFVAGVKSWWNDPKKLDPTVLKQTASELIPDVPGGWTVWLIGLGAIALLVALGYASRGTKELVRG